MQESDIDTAEQDHDFDVRAALSQRDKAIAERDKRIREMEDKLSRLGSSAESDGVLGDEQTDNDTGGEGAIQGGLSDRLDRIEQLVSALGTRAFDMHFGTQQRAKDEDFVNWAKDRKLSEIDPRSPTLEEAFMDARESGDDQLAQSILAAYDKEMRGSVSSVYPDINRSTRVTPEQKKAAEKIKQLERERLAADKMNNFAEVKRLNAEIRHLRRQ